MRRVAPHGSHLQRQRLRRCAGMTGLTLKLPPHDSLRLLRSRRCSSASSCVMPRRWCNTSSWCRSASFRNAATCSAMKATASSAPPSPGSSPRARPRTLDAARDRFLPGLVTRPHPNPCPAGTLRRHQSQLQGGNLQLSRYEIFPLGRPFNTPRFDSEGLTTHVRVETADPNPFEFGPNFSRKLLE